MQAPCPALGIDLGTANTCVAVYRDGKCEIIPDDGRRVMPSVVAFTPHARLVGNAARKQAHANPRNTITSALHFLGRQVDELDFLHDARHLPFRVLERAGSIAFEVEDQSTVRYVTPEEIVAMILAKAKDNAISHLGVPVFHAVITVPASWSNTQRRITCDLARAAGLDALALVSGSTAAAMAYHAYYPSPRDERLLFVDLGAGSCDATLVRVGQEIVDVLSTDGSQRLGGDDYDTLLMGHVLEEYRQRHRVNSTQAAYDPDPRILRCLRSACERVKCELSAQTQIELQIDHWDADTDFGLTITRSQFENLCARPLSYLEDVIERVLRDAKLDRRALDGVIAVGGSARIPKIKSNLSQLLDGREVSTPINLDKAAAYGAAILAAIRSGHDDIWPSRLNNTLLMDVLPLSIGIEVFGGKMLPLVKRNTTVPTRKSEVVSFDTPQAHFSVSVFEGESERTKDNNFLGTLTLPLHQFSHHLSLGVLLALRVEMTVYIDGLGTLTIEATEKATSETKNLMISKYGGLLGTEFDRIKREVESYRTDRQAEAARVLEESSIDSAAFDQDLDGGSHATEGFRVTKLAHVAGEEKNNYRPLSSHQTDKENRITCRLPGAIIPTGADVKVASSIATAIRKAGPSTEHHDHSMASLWLHLKTRDFRLLYRVGGTCRALKLRHHKMEYPPRYCALSCVWGDQAKDHDLLCTNHEATSNTTLKITKTLSEALKAVLFTEMPIWVDSLCINQEDHQEKSIQVASLHRIYRRADHVIIWLGDQQEHTVLALEVFNWISMPPKIGHEQQWLELFPNLKRYLQQNQSSVQIANLQNLASVIGKAEQIPINEKDFQRLGLPAFEDQLWRALGSVLSPPWLFSLWKFQELMLAKDCSVAHGGYQLPWRTYFDVGMQFSLCGLLEHCHNQLGTTPESKERALTAFTRLDRFCNTRQEIVPFWQYLDEARYRDCTESVDRVYAVLSLANEKLRSRITVDSSQAWKARYWELFMEASKAVMMTSSLQAILAGANSKAKAKELPSWCPDFNVPSEVTPFGADARAGMGYGKSLTPHYNPKIINVGGVSVDLVDRIMDFSWTWPRGFSIFYGPGGLAAQNLKWLDDCWALTRDTYVDDEDGARRAFVCTILGQIPHSSTLSQEDPEDALEAQLNELDEELINVRRQLEDLIVSAAPEDLEENYFQWHKFQAKSKELYGIWRNRIFFTTKNGRVGFASDRISSGDHVCLLFGESHMYILRDRPDGCHQFISDAYVDGYMGGEGTANLPKSRAFKIY